MEMKTGAAAAAPERREDMQVITFASIEISSYEVGMKILELSSKNGIKEIDYIRHGLELGKDAYVHGEIGNEMLEELCEILEDFTRIMKGYQVEDYRACATSAIRDTRNCLLILDKIRVRTGLEVEILSNSEQRFLGYKSIASNEESFQKIIQKGTAIVDVGGGSIQISLFDKDALVSTQNLRLGIVRIRERLAEIEQRTTHFDEIVEEMINNELNSYKRLYLKDREIKHMILVGDYINQLITRRRGEKSVSFTREEYQKLYQEIASRSPQEMVGRLGTVSDNMSLVMPALIIYRRLIEETGAEKLWIPGRNLCDGLAYDYAERKKIFKSSHNFENDIIEAAKNIAKRYQSNKTHLAGTEYLALTIFDKMKRIHGMSRRERLLLQIAVLLHDCGKYISMNRTAQCSYEIVMSTEIIGLSHREREIIANAIRFNTEEFVSFEEFSMGCSLDRNDYLLTAKISAILRVANSMDRSHKQKFKNVKVTLKDRELIVVVDTVEDITLEQGLFSHKADFFESIFSIRPILRQKRQV